MGLVGAQVHDIDGLRQLVVKTTATGAPVRMADVATVSRRTLPIYTTVTANGKNAVLHDHCPPAFEQYSRRCRCGLRADRELRKKLPQGVKLELFYDQSQLVRDSISSVRDAIFIGLILACIILFLFLRDWTSSLIAGLVIPVTIAATVLVLWAIDQSFNLMTLGGLAAAIGLVIDDAIVVVENIVMHRDHGESRVKPCARHSKKSLPADRFHHYARGRISAASRRKRRYGQLLPRTGHYHGRLSAHVTSSRAHLDARDSAWFFSQRTKAGQRTQGATRLAAS